MLDEIHEMCPVCEDVMVVPNKGLGRAKLAAWRTQHQHREHPAHSGHEFGGAYARAAALAAGDPDWTNATGGRTSPDAREEQI